MREEQVVGPKRSSKHESNNTTAGITKWYDRKGNKTTKGAKDGLKREKPTIKQGLALEKSKPIKNGKLENSSCYKKSRISGRMHRQVSRPWQTHEQQTSFWRTQEVEHAQRPGTTNLYPSNTRVVGHGSEVRASMIWR